MRSPCSLGRVPTSVTTSSASCASTCPRSWRSCTRSSTSAIQTRFGVTSTPAPRGGSLRSRGSRAPCTAPCAVWRQAPAMRASRQWAPVLPENCWGHRRSWRRRTVPQYRGFKPTPTSQITEAKVFDWWERYHLRHEGYTRPSRATQLVRPPSVSPSVGLRMRSLVPSARAALGVLGHAGSDARTLNSFGNLASLCPLFSTSPLCFNRDRLVTRRATQRPPRWGGTAKIRRHARRPERPDDRAPDTLTRHNR